MNGASTGEEAVDVVAKLRGILAGMEERLRQRVAEEQQATANRLVQEGAVEAMRYALQELGERTTTDGDRNG